MDEAEALAGGAAPPPPPPTPPTTTTTAPPQEDPSQDQSYGDPGSEEGDEILPIEDVRLELANLIRLHNIVVCVGETGSGKTTKIPQIILDEGLAGTKAIAVTQPRRVAAITVAERVAEERGCTLGREVGYMVRFDDCTCSSTKIKFMTDGCLVRECLTDPLLSAYSVIMLDEAHERSIHTDILFGLMKQCLRKRSDLKVVVTSATLDVEKVSSYYDNCPVMTVPGRVFPVQIYHSKHHQVMTASGPATDSYVEACVETALKIHFDQDEGHILVFLTGQDEIERACQSLRKQVHESADSIPHGRYTALQVLPMYSALPADVQKRVFERLSSNIRKCVFATNIAETSITVPGIRYVVDSGFVKQKVYNPQTHMEHLVVVPISQVAALQRSGRAGRTAPGQCYRMYSKDSLMQMMRETIPEIKRSNLANTILYLKVLGVHDILAFDFLEPPSHEQMLLALTMLHALGALDDEGRVTHIGLQMSSFPLEPNISRMLIEGNEQKCTEEALTIAAMLSVEHIWYTRKRRTREVDEEAVGQHLKLRHKAGDHMTYLRVFQQWEDRGYSDAWLNEYFIHRNSMHLARRIRMQLEDEASKAGLNPSLNTRDCTSNSSFSKIGRAITAGFFMNAAKRTSNATVYSSLPAHGFTGKVSLMYLHPQSSLVHSETPPEYVIYQELVYTAKAFMRHVLKVKMEWLEHCRRQVSGVSAYRLSGQEEPVTKEDDGVENDLDSRKRPRTVTSTDVKQQPIPQLVTLSRTEIDSARQRFLARKRAKQS